MSRVSSFMTSLEPARYWRNLAAAVWIVAGAIAALPAAATAAEVRASVDRPQLAVGESTVLSISVEGSQDAAAPEIGAVAGFAARYVGPSTQMTFSNGQMSSSVTHRYQLIARRAGRYELGPFEVVVDGATLRSEPVVVQVLPPGGGAGAAGAQAAPALRMEVRLGRANPFVGERVPLTIRVLIPGGMRVDDLQFPTVEAGAATVGEMPQPTQREERIGGRPHRVLYFDTHLTPLAPGPRELVVSMGMNVLESRRGNRGGVFGMFGDMLAERRPVEVRSEPIELAPRALPVGRPPSFTGAVGSFDLEVSASPLTVNAGDPVTLRIAVSGEGDITKVRPPRFGEIEGFRVYDPVPVKDAGIGRRMIEQVVIPQTPEADELPQLAFSFFDPQAETYRTVHRGPIGLNVGAAAGVASGVVAEGESGLAERLQGPLGRDIVYIKNAPGTWRHVGRSGMATPALWLFNAVPLVVVGLLWWRYRRANLLAANPALQRFRRADAKARTALSELAGRRDEPRFFDDLARTLTEYLAAKLALPPGAADAQRLAAELRRAGYGDDLGAEAEGLVATLEGVRYAPDRGADDRGDLLARAERLVAAVEKKRDVNERLAKAICALLAVAAASLAPMPAVGAAVAEAAGAAVPAAAAAADGAANAPEASFFAGNHAYADGRYGEAAALYERVLAAGEESGALHYNLGNAYFKKGDVARALASYLRARRLLPRDPDVAANLSFARESLELAADRDPLWRRVAFALAYRLSAAELTLAATALWWLLLAGVAGGLLAPRLRDGLRWPLRVVLVLFLIAAANLAYRQQVLELWHQAVVTAPTGTVVRFEPSSDGTEHFEAPAGARLSVGERRDGWVQVARSDGRRGWAESGTVTLLRPVDGSGDGPS